MLLHIKLQTHVNVVEIHTHKPVFTCISPGAIRVASLVLTGATSSIVIDGMFDTIFISGAACKDQIWCMYHMYSFMFILANPSTLFMFFHTLSEKLLP